MWSTNSIWTWTNKHTINDTWVYCFAPSKWKKSMISCSTDRHGMSCNTQLCTTYKDLAKAAKNGKTTHSIILDSKKAFDELPRSLLMQKVNQHKLQICIHSLSTRSMISCLGADKEWHSRNKPQEKCQWPLVPHGGHSWDQHCICFTSMTSLTHWPAFVSLYADNTLFYHKVNTPGDMHHFQQNIEAMYDWSQQ